MEAVLQPSTTFFNTGQQNALANLLKQSKVKLKINHTTRKANHFIMYCKVLVTSFKSSDLIN